MNAREERGLVIAATQRLIQKGKVWLVPSQSGRGRYTVCPDPDSPFCSCPDHEETGQRCKHLYAVEFVMNRETHKDGTVTETRTLTLTEKKTYRQDWPNYNTAQIEEKKRFQALLADLCRGLIDPPANRAGRKRTAMADMVFAAAYKVYSGMSSRRFGTDLEEAAQAGYLTHRLHPVMIGSFLESPLLTPVLGSLIVQSALPLRSVESNFAIDSSGFGSSRFETWIDEKYGTTRRKAVWVKAHIASGVRTHVVTAVRILDKDSADCPQFVPLVKQTRQGFDIGEVSADAAYGSLENFEQVAGMGGTLYAAFKSNTTGAVGGAFERAFHYFSLRREEYMAHYHRRSNVESTFSAIKRKFGDAVRSKTDTAMVNEVLCKILAHNITCLILAELELGIPARFRDDDKAAAPDAAAQAPAPTAADAPPPAAPAPISTTPPDRPRFFCVGA
ncbi:MAG TPA: transposase [Gemmataceae bacterium]|nr:transposase [Gemmataceae bacterium]